MNELSKKQRKLDFKPAQKRKSTSSTPAPSPLKSSTPKGAKIPGTVSLPNLSLSSTGSSTGSSSLFGPFGPAIEMTMVEARSRTRSRPYNVTMNGLPVRLQAGPRRLVVKNLRPREKVDNTIFFIKKQEQIDDATWQIFHGNTPGLPLTTLAQYVEDQVRADRGDRLEESLDDSLEAYLTEVASRISSSPKLDTLKTAVKEWKDWEEVTTRLRSVFSDYDHVHLLHGNPPTTLLAQCINAFKDYALGEIELRNQIYTQINDLINHDRQAGSLNAIDSGILLSAIEMLTDTKLYKAEWEPAFLASSQTYFETCAQEPMAMDKYITNVVDFLNNEVNRCETYCFDSTTRVSLLKLGRNAMVRDRQDFLLQDDKIGAIIQNGDIETIKNLYKLLQTCSISEKLRGPWELFIKKRGGEICAAKENSDKLVSAVLEFKVLCESFLVEAFNNDPLFKKFLKSAFSSFINSRHTKHPWGMGGDKVGELLAKYVDLLMRGGLNAVPEGLVRKSTLAAPDLAGEALEEYRTKEFDRQIHLVLDLFRHIDGRDTFLSYYKLHLARRLLNGRMRDESVEKAMIDELEEQGGEDYVKDLNTMFKDIRTSREELAAYEEDMWPEVARPQRKVKLEFGVSMLTSSAWPSYPEENVNVPDVVAREIEMFDGWYGKRETGRKVAWKHSLAQCELRANLPNGKKYLVIGGFQAIVLCLFNDVKNTESLSYDQIQAATGLSSQELDRTLASLACGKQKILIKDPPAGGIATTDTFRVNLAFTAKSNRVKIPQVALKDTRLDEVSVVKKVNMDRDFEVQGAIVRVLKAVCADGGRRLDADELLIATNKEIMKDGRSAVTTEEVEKHTKKLIGKDFIDAEDGQYLYLP